jgi:imidazolonepropionase-like amidohydrolase
MTTSPIAGALSAAHGAVWISVGTLIDGTSTIRAAHVVYDGDHIRFVGRNGATPPRDLLRPGQAAPDVEAPLHTLLPALVDAHTHLYLEGGALDAEVRRANRRHSPAELLAHATRRLERLAPLGIAGMRDAGDKEGVGLALSRRSKMAGNALPFVDSPGAAIHREGRYGSFMGSPVEHYASAKACVEARVAAGADRIKIIASGIVDFPRAAVPGPAQFSTPEVAEIVGAAKALNRQTLAHASGEAGIESAIAGGVDSLEHGYFITDTQLARMRDARIAWVPTFAPVQAQLDHAATLGWDATATANLRAILDRHATSLLRARELGVTIVAGSDAGSQGVPHGFGLFAELEAMERAGLSSVEVIAAATGAGADRFAYAGQFGKIEAGYQSRFILTYHDPLASVANLRKARMVVFDGQVFETTGEADDRGL